MKKQISIFEAVARANFDPGIARGVQWGIWEAAWLAANMEESTGPDGHPFYRLPESDNRDYWQARWAAPFALDAEKSAYGKTLDELKAEQFALESARGRIDQLLDANLKLQANLAKIDSMKADTSETAKAVKVIFEKTTKARSGISAATASKIWAILSPADAPTDDTIRNWIKAGHLAKHPAIIIAENHLATKSSFVQWLLGAFENMGKGKHTPTQAQIKQIESL